MQVVELEVFMTPAMEEIYQAISELMDACIKELRKSNKIDTSELTVENGIFTSFDDIIRRQLDSIWHTVSPRTKQVGLQDNFHCHWPETQQGWSLIFSAGNIS